MKFINNKECTTKSKDRDSDNKIRTVESCSGLDIGIDGIVYSDRNEFLEIHLQESLEVQASRKGHWAGSAVPYLQVRLRLACLQSSPRMTNDHN